MNELDSRAIRIGDHFLQKFLKEGVVKYQLLPPSGKKAPSSSSIYEIEVKARQSPSPKHVNVLVSVNTGVLVVDTPKVEIEVNDVVLWRTNDQSLPGFIVNGQDGPIYLNSEFLKGDCVYTHAFGLPGTYDWKDPHLGKISGRVNVTRPKDAKISQLELNKVLAQGTAIKINGDHVDPKEVSVLQCQSVFWIVEAADGIGISGERKP